METQKEIIKEVRKKTRNRRIIVFIDEHEIPWFGKPNEYVVGTNNFNGTKLAFRYITINTVIDEQRICLFALPVTPFSSKHKLVDELLKFAKQFFRIGLVLFDRGFSKDSKILRIVEKHGLKYLAPMEKSYRIKRIANTGDGVNPFYHTGYEFGIENATTNLFFIPNGKYEKDKWKSYHVFCTNIDVTKANLLFLSEIYGKRWNIENFYRDAGNNFMIKTKTDDFVARYFFFLFTAIIYNIWHLVRKYSNITAEELKDLIEDELRKNDEAKLKLVIVEILRLKRFYYYFTMLRRVSLTIIFIEKTNSFQFTGVYMTISKIIATFD